MRHADLIVNLEAILFMAAGPLRPAILARATGASRADVKAGLATLEKQLDSRGIRLVHINDEFVLTTAPKTAHSVEQFIGSTSKAGLSAAALETLAIIAYNGPVTRSEIEAIRGVSAETTVKQLLQRGLIETKGQRRVPGRPLLYHVTTGFLTHLGLTKLADLPPLESLTEEA